MNFSSSRLAAQRSARAENLLQAIVRNPMLRGDYGPNLQRRRRKRRGSDRAMIGDTAQLFKAIKAIVKVKG